MDFKVLVEIPEGGSVKYEIDKESGRLAVDRFLHTSFVYPFNYGYIPDSKAKDGDPVDVIVLSSQPVLPGVFIKCHALGILMMEDEAGKDEKILAVPDKKIDPVFGSLDSIRKVNPAVLEKIKHFFEHYKGLEPGKWVKIGDFEGKITAEKYIQSSLEKK